MIVIHLPSVSLPLASLPIIHLALIFLPVCQRGSAKISAAWRGVCILCICLGTVHVCVRVWTLFDGVNREAIYKLRKRVPLQKFGRVWKKYSRRSGENMSPRPLSHFCAASPLLFFSTMFSQKPEGRNWSESQYIWLKSRKLWKCGGKLGVKRWRFLEYFWNVA